MTYITPGLPADIPPDAEILSVSDDLNLKVGAKVDHPDISVERFPLAPAVRGGRGVGGMEQDGGNSTVNKAANFFTG